MSRAPGAKFAVSLLVGWALAAGGVTAADGELRTFAVTVDGRPAGSFKMAVRVDGDGKETIAAVASVKVKIGPLAYTYTLQSLEVWQGGKLVSVEANANNDGKKFALRAAAAADGLTVTVNDKTHKAAAGVLTSTGWRQPAADAPRDAALFDTEDGTVTAVRLEPLGAGRVTLNGRTIEGPRVRVTGKDVDTVWWYDGAGRPVRQEMTWDGHKVVLELTTIGR